MTEYISGQTRPDVVIIMTDEERYPPPYETAAVAEFRLVSPDGSLEVVKRYEVKQPDPQHDRRTRPRNRRQHEAHRPDQVRRHPQHHLALDQRLAHQPKPSLLEIAQPAVNELGGGRRRAGGKVVLLDQQDA